MNGAALISQADIKIIKDKRSETKEQMQSLKNQVTSIQEQLSSIMPAFTEMCKHVENSFTQITRTTASVGSLMEIASSEENEITAKFTYIDMNVVNDRNMDPLNGNNINNNIFDSLHEENDEFFNTLNV
jgi:uncharacterized membrane-anchored protein YhcB (DUF1043 family)